MSIANFDARKCLAECRTEFGNARQYFAVNCGLNIVKNENDRQTAKSLIEESCLQNYEKLEILATFKLPEEETRQEPIALPFPKTVAKVKAPTLNSDGSVRKQSADSMSAAEESAAYAAYKKDPGKNHADWFRSNPELCCGLGYGSINKILNEFDERIIQDAEDEAARAEREAEEANRKAEAARIEAERRREERAMAAEEERRQEYVAKMAILEEFLKDTGIGEGLEQLAEMPKLLADIKGAKKDIAEMRQSLANSVVAPVVRQAGQFNVIFDWLSGLKKELNEVRNMAQEIQNWVRANNKKR